MTGQPTTGALDGVKVADFAWAVAGPLVTKVLAVHGATVVKVETNHRLDGTRVGPPFGGKPSRNRSAYYTDINPGKLSITLDLRKPEGIEVAKRLCRWADVVNENFSPGVMDRWGLGYDDLAAEDPSIIMLSSSMQGADGPRATHPGLGATLGALVGINHFTGWPDAEPVGVARPYTDTIAPWFGAVAVLAALEHRDRTGEGQHIDLSQYEATTHMIAPALLDHTVNGAAPGRVGNASPGAAPYGAYRCHESEGAPDGGQGEWVAIAVTLEEQWEGFKRALDGEAWVEEGRFQTALGRVAAGEEIDALVEGWTSRRTAGEAADLLQSHGVPAASVADGRTLHADPQLAHLGVLAKVDHPRIGQHHVTHPAFRLSETPPRPSDKARSSASTPSTYSGTSLVYRTASTPP